MLKLIVNADDMGLTEKVNEGILQAHQTGIVTSTSIIANGAAFEDAVTRCKKVATLDLGVHLTLVEERPCLKPDLIPTLVDSAGKLHHHATAFVKKYLAGKIQLEEVWRELDAQLRKVVSHGIRVSHLDSHQHLHMLPQILGMTVKLARKYDIPAIRVPREPIRPYMFRGAGALPRVLELMALNGFCFLGQSRIKLRADHVAGFHIAGNLNKKNLQKLLQSLPDDGTCELMCHPGLDDPSSRYTHWRYRWQDELNALVDPEIAEYLRQRGIPLVSYRELTDSKLACGNDRSEHATELPTLN
jgi:chitin disaccharide deacetylase